MIGNKIMTQCLKAMGLTENTEYHVQCTTFFMCRLPTPETLPKYGVLGCLFEKSREHQVTQASNQTNPVPLATQDMFQLYFPCKTLKPIQEYFNGPL